MIQTSKKLFFSILLLIVIVALTVGAVVFVNSKPKEADLAPFIASGSFSITQGISNLHMGYIDEEGRLALPADYNLALPFSEGLAYVAGIDDTFGFINTSGELVIDIGSMALSEHFLMAEVFSEGMALIREISGDSKSGFIDREGNLKIELRYEAARSFSDGVAAVMDDGRWGFVDKEGQMVIEPQYDDAGSFRDGIAFVKLGEEYHAIDQTGEMLFKIPGTPYDLTYTEGLLPVKVAESFGYVDTDGNMHIDAKYEYAFDFSEGLAAVQSDGKWGYINTEGEMTIEASYDSANRFVNGQAFVQQDGRWGIINTKGEYIEEPQYDRLSSMIPDNLMPFLLQESYYPFSERLEGFVAQLGKGDETYYVHEDGRIILIEAEVEEGNE